MNPIILKFADGSAFFAGLALVLMAEALLLGFSNRIVRHLLNGLVLVGVTLVVASATPQPLWAYGIWGLSAVAGIVLLPRAASAKKLHVVSYAVLLACTVGLCMAEAPYRRCPKVTVPEGTTVYVLGDSISAGVGTGDRCWPVVLGELTSFRVVNLAQPGATVKSALVQTKGIKESRAVVIVEIGGNDLLGETAAAEFRDTLDTLVSSLRANQHQILLLELPLFPFKNAFGRAQRDVVSKYGVAMLPKRCLAAALGAQNGTLDGLHLSQAGHNALAGILAGVMERK